MKHVLVEKAFCATSSEAVNLLTFAREKGLVCMPYQNRRFDSDFLTLRRIIAEGNMGDIVEYNGFFNRYSPRIRTGMWKDSVAGSGGNFLSLGSHMIDQAVILFGAPTRVWADIRCQREGGVLDDAWEVHLFYETSSNATADGEGLHKGGFRAILKGSFLCVDHKIRYMVHGRQGSWVKRGIDQQEAFLMTGRLPAAIPGQGRETDCDDGYGKEDPSQWGELTLAARDGGAGQCARTPAEIGSYYKIYDDVYDRVTGDRGNNGIDMIPVIVLRVIEIAKRSSLLRQVVSFDMEL